MSDSVRDIRNILVLCTGNSARSILGEALFNLYGEGRIRAYSAGSKPKAAPHSGALRLLTAKGIDASAFRSKSWDEFTGPDAPDIELAITVCGNAAGEVCPIFRGSALKAHWGLSDPANVVGDNAEIDAAFAETWRLLEMRVKAFMALDLKLMDKPQMQAMLADIGMMEGAA